MPHALELPRMRLAVVPLMRARIAFVDELVALALGHSFGSGAWFALRCAGLLPCFPAVAGALNDLAEPSAGLRDVKPLRIDGRTFRVIDLPARKVRPAHVPLFSRAVRAKDEKT